MKGKRAKQDGSPTRLVPEPQDSFRHCSVSGRIKQGGAAVVDLTRLAFPPGPPRCQKVLQTVSTYIDPQHSLDDGLLESRRVGCPRGHRIDF